MLRRELVLTAPPGLTRSDLRLEVFSRPLQCCRSCRGCSAAGLRWLLWTSSRLHSYLTWKSYMSWSHLRSAAHLPLTTARLLAEKSQPTRKQSSTTWTYWRQRSVDYTDCASLAELFDTDVQAYSRKVMLDFTAGEYQKTLLPILSRCFSSVLPCLPGPFLLSYSVFV